MKHSDKVRYSLGIRRFEYEVRLVLTTIFVLGMVISYFIFFGGV